MINDNQIESRVIDGDIWVRMEDFIERLHGVAETALDLAEVGNIPYLAIQAHGLAEFGEGLERILIQLRAKNGLTDSA